MVLHFYLMLQIAHVQMNQKNADLDLPKKIVKELMGKGVQVNVAIFRSLLTAQWEARDTEGVEETLESMLVSGHTPILKACSLILCSCEFICNVPLDT